MKWKAFVIGVVLSISPVVASAVTLQWDAYTWPVGATGTFILEKSITPSGNWTVIATSIPGTAVTFEDAAGATAACYRLKAQAQGYLTSPPSNLACFTELPAPRNLRVTGN